MINIRTKWRYKYEPIKKKIIEVAYYLFTEKSYGEVTIKQISEHAKVAYGTVYFHFNSGKDGVLNHIAKVLIDDFYQIVEVEFNAKTLLDVRERIYNQMMQSFKIVNENKRIMQVLWEAKGKSEIVYNNFKALQNKFIQRIYHDIEQNRKKGLGKNVNALLASKALMHMVWGFIWDYTMEEEKNEQDITETITNMYINGVY